MGQKFVGLDVTGAISLGQNVGQDVLGQNFVRQDVTGAISLGQKVLEQEVGHPNRYLNINNRIQIFLIS